VSTALGRRLVKLEAVRRDEYEKRWRVAADRLLRSMDPDHVAELQGWMREHCGGLSVRRQPGDTWYSILERYEPPALVRAVWLLMSEQMATGAPLSLIPELAEVYRSDPDAFPANPCGGCGYLLPTRARLRQDSTYIFLRGVYVGICPVCERDIRPELEASP
jgi:hypothetical protein